MNHKRPSNVTIDRSLASGEIRFSASRKVVSGEELFVDYGDGSEVIFYSDGRWELK
jgi:hypothetical protein